MKESFLHYLWLHQRLYTESLRTTDGQSLSVIDPGTHNRNAGPDFFNARLRIGTTLWAGNVEIHVRSSDWYRHGHQDDPLYSNCILHVVLQHDQPVSDVDRQELLTLELAGKFDPAFLENYERLIDETEEIPCSSRLHTVNPLIKSLLADRMMIERLEERSNAMVRLLEATTWHWEEAFFHALARNFGFHVNADPFERLARSLPYPVLLRLRERLLSLEALLFGQAGFLPDTPVDDYLKRLREEYLFQRQRLRIQPVMNPGWKFLRLRPANFPTVRIAQLAMVLHASFPVFQRCVEADSLDQLMRVFRFGVSTYWKNHVRPEHASVEQARVMGEDAIRLIVVNTVVPFLFLRGKRTGDESLCERALSYLQRLPAEDNRVLRLWKNAGWQPNNAGESQGLLQLHRQYCLARKCIHCSLGNEFILAGRPDEPMLPDWSR